MKQVIYVDVLLALNLLLSFFLLSAAGRLANERVSVGRMLLGSFLGSAVSLTVFLPQCGIVLGFLLRAVLLLPVVFAAFGFGSLRRYVRLWLITAGVSCLFAGALVGAWFLFKPSGLVLRNGAVYFEIGFLPLVLGCGAFYAAIWLFRRFFAKRNDEKASCFVRFEYNSKVFTCKGMVDTANTLKDPFTGQAVQVISESLAHRLIPAYGGEATQQLAAGMRLLPCVTANGEGTMPAFDVSLFSAKTAQETAQLPRAVLAISSNRHFSQGCEILVNATVLFESEKGGRKHENHPMGSSIHQKTKGKKERSNSLHKRSRYAPGTAEQQAGEGADRANCTRR
ncbi:MAG TPA: hypothetical protein DDY98_07555 [Ruminococcaceae bacterium]|nr:hypothetical protein [Oscillospiraceae bacterium]